MTFIIKILCRAEPHDQTFEPLVELSKLRRQHLSPITASVSCVLFQGIHVTRVISPGGAGWNGVIFRRPLVC